MTDRYTCSICGPVCIHMRQTNEAEHARINVTLSYRHGWMDPRKVFAIVDRHDDEKEKSDGKA